VKDDTVYRPSSELSKNLDMYTAVYPKLSAGVLKV